MSKIKLGAVPLVYPIPIVLVGATVDGVANFTEVGDCAVMGLRPALVTISFECYPSHDKGNRRHGRVQHQLPVNGDAFSN